jgi:hypothetical protein
LRKGLVTPIVPNRAEAINRRVSWAGIEVSTTRAAESFDPFTVAKRIGPVPKKNKSDNSRSEMEPIKDEPIKMTAPNDEKRDEFEELYRDIGGEG